MRLDLLKYEFNYWALTYHKHSEEKYLKYFEIWKLDPSVNYGSVLEIASGPFLGVLPLIKAESKIAIDPNFGRFVRYNMLRNQDSIARVNKDFNDCSYIASFDTVFLGSNSNLVNLLVFEKVFESLKSKGSFYLHSHIRKKSQFRPNILLSRVIKELSLVGFKEVWSKFYPIDPIPQYIGTPRSVLVGEWKKV